MFGVVREPEVAVDWAMLADHVVVDQRGKPSIIGIFQRLTGTRFPKLHPICFAVARLAGPPSERVPVQVRFWSPDEVLLVAREQSVEIGADGDAICVAPFSPLSLPVPGDYVVETVPGGGRPHRLTLHVEQVPTRSEAHHTLA